MIKSAFSAEEYFSNRFKHKLFNVYLKVTKSIGWYENSSFTEDLYYLLKQIKDTAALFHLNGFYESSFQLLKCFTVDNHYIQLDLKRIDEFTQHFYSLIEPLTYHDSIASRKIITETAAAKSTVESTTSESQTLSNYFPFEKEEIHLLIRKEWVRYQRFESYFSLILLKFDALQMLQGEYNSEILNEYIDQLFEMIRNSLRIYDESKRWGLNTIMIMLPATRLTGAKIVGKRIIKQINNIKTLYHIASFTRIAISESELEYQNVDAMIERLESEINRFSTDSQIYCLPSIAKHLEAKGQPMKVKVLIIDDDPVPSSLFQNHLLSEEWDIEICLSGGKALDLALSFQPDFIICETRMKDLDGYTFCSIIRQFSQFNNTYFFFLTKQTLNQHIVRGFQVGADDYITKPFSVQEIEMRMRRYLNRNLNS